jgi:PHD/YefM family antitoxin component YafN of YafNO toxin-antitoxin module
MAKRLRVTMSKARAHLFELADFVRSDEDTVVVLEERGNADAVALVREARLNYLEESVKHAAKREATAFKVAGSLSSRLDDEELLGVLRDLRKAWQAAPVSRRKP